MATGTTKQTSSRGLKGAAKHLTKTSPATARTIARHQERQAEVRGSVARLVKRDGES